MSRVNYLLPMAIALSIGATPALAQDHSTMPGMTMPMPKAAPAKKAALKKEPARKPAAAKPASAKAGAARPARKPAAPMPAPAKAPAMQGMDHSKMDMSGGDMQGMDHSKMDMSGGDMQGMDHSKMDMSGGGMQGMDPSKMDMSGGDMQGMDHSKMDMSGGDMQGMDHSKMAMPGMGPDPDLPADAAPRTPVPVPTDADRAAAFMPTGGHAVHDKSIQSMWLVDRLEVTDEARTGAWDAVAWIGGDLNRVWLRSEGETADGRVGDGDLEVLYGRSVATWWDVVAGVRQDFGEGPSRTYAAFGVQGLAPYKYEVQATAYIGNGGRTALRLDAEYDTLFTNRLILQWRGEANLYGRNDPARGIGSGLSSLEAGARLRYEITRRFAPYIGVEVGRAFGNTARLRRSDVTDSTDTRVVAGIRFWF